MTRKIKVGLIYGGKSGEHDVSLSTAMAVTKEIDFNKYEVIPFYITKQGEWRSGAALKAAVQSKEQLTFGGEGRAVQRSGSSNALLPLFGGLQPAEDTAVISSTSGAAAEPALDVVFPLLHGTFGEDGTVQGLLEIANVPYVGAGVLASAVGMDKVMMKKVFAQAGLPQVVFRHFTRTQWAKDRDEHVMEIEVSVGYPCFVKPANLGSSVGISKARNRDELLAAVDEAFQYDRKVIVEEGVDAREVEVAVLGNDEPEASVVGEIVSSNEFYDYKAKYLDGKSVMVIPAEISPEQSDAIREMAIRAYEAVDGSGLSRVDFFLTREDGKVLINEINTMPGFTPFSMYPLLWRETGKPYGQLLDDLIRLAIERHADKQKIKYTFDLD
ncbi:D-alanine--D-alanine ligase [Paenibacillus chartarius]|uniref:D-alanine--D-alanine ligase n=1 Tax=Paenibacillus chartarius TaxID=747481 RepID=A0ABV6DSF5_9BACL